MPGHPKVFLGFDHYVPALHRGVVRAARELDWDLQTNANDRLTPAGRRFDGVLLQYGADPKLDALADAHPGRVVDFTRIAPHVPLPRVTIDPAGSGTLAAEFLMRRGHRDFAVVVGRHWGDRARRDAFVGALAAAGHACAEWSPVEFAREHPEVWSDSDALSTFLSGKLSAVSGPLAVFCMHDTHADLLLRVARDLGVAVPGRLAVLGCDNDELVCEAARPPLSSIDLNFETVGYEAALRLHALMRGDTDAPADTGVPPAGVIERLSTGALRTDNPLVRKALAELERAGEAEPDVETLARAAGVNRRALERAFRSALGCSPLEFLIRHRLERATSLMRENPAMSGPVVAERLGYKSIAHFYRQFAAVKGVSVEEFRRRHTAMGVMAARQPPGRAKA